MNNKRGIDIWVGDICKMYDEEEGELLYVVINVQERGFYGGGKHFELLPITLNRKAQIRFIWDREQFALIS